MTIGAYETVRLLGKGGMSEVYEVRHGRLGTEHALKRFAYSKDDPDVTERFEREGRLLARLRHPRIVRVTDIGRDGDRPYFVMDLIRDDEGRIRTLGDVPPGSVDEETVGRWYDDLREGLAYIHARGIVHRDLKLENVMIGPDGHAVLTDFGISKVSDGAATPAEDPTNTILRARDGKSLVMGSVGYMAPELEMGVAASAASDYYALGVIVYRLLTGLWCDARTDVRDSLETFDPVWLEILPKLLHANPQGRACVSYAALRRQQGERREAELEERWLREKARGHFARHAARYLLVALLGVGAAWGIALHRTHERDRQLHKPAFSDVFRLPASEDASGKPVLPNRSLATLADAWVLTHGLFDDLRADKITLDKLADALGELEQRGRQGTFLLFPIVNGYTPTGDPKQLQRMLKAAADDLRARQTGGNAP